MPSSYACKRLAALALLCLPPHLTAGEEPPPEPVHAPTARATETAPAWVHLQFDADGLTGSVTTSLKLMPATMAELDLEPYRELQDTPEPFSGSPLLRLQVDGEVRTLFGSSGTRARVWFDASGQALLRERTRTGRNGSSKIHRFGRRGASRLRLEPADNRQAQQPIAQWTRCERKFFAYDMQRTGCSSISVPALLLYSIARQPALTSHCVFLDDALYRVRLESRGNSMQPVSYELHGHDGTRQVSGARRLEKIALRIEPLSKKAKLEDFELLELRGDLAILLDPQYRIPVQVSGSRAGLGAITIRLTAATAGRDTDH